MGAGKRITHGGGSKGRRGAIKQARKDRTTDTTEANVNQFETYMATTFKLLSDEITQDSVE